MVEVLIATGAGGQAHPFAKLSHGELFAVVDALQGVALGRGDAEPALLLSIDELKDTNDIVGKLLKITYELSLVFL